MKRIMFGDLCDANTHQTNIIVHGCNAQGVMGSGVALAVKQRWPGAYEEYKKYVNNIGVGKPELLGLVIPYSDTKNKILVANAITQLNFGKDGRKYVSYQAVYLAFNTIAEIAANFEGSIGIHYPMIGAGLGGGDWAVISDIIESTFSRYPHLEHHLWIRE